MPGRRQKRRSLRLKTLVIAVALVVTPHLLMGVTMVWEAILSASFRKATVEAAQAAAVIAASSGAAEQASQLEALARKLRLRIRLFDDENGSVLVDADHALHIGPIRRWLGDAFFGPSGRPTLAAYDARLPLPMTRQEVQAARGGRSIAHCERSRDGRLMICSAAARIADQKRFVHVQDASGSTTWPVYLVRYELLKISLVTLGLGLVLAWWMGRRIVRPVEALRDQVLERAHAAAPRPDLDTGRRDEIGELSIAFNDLLGVLQERTRANEAFVADLCHEFKNPVAAIRASAELLDGGATSTTSSASAPVDAERAAKIAHILNDAWRRLDVLVTEFLELARAEGGLPRESRHPVELAALLGGLVEVRRERQAHAEEKLTFTLEVPPAEVIVSGVPSRLESVFSNLLDNAASFAGAGGSVGVLLVVEEGWTEIRVSDSGPGIAAPDLPRVFERFYTSRRGSGTGLGLALARAVVEAHAGTIRPESLPGRGATLIVRLPLAGRVP